MALRIDSHPESGLTPTTDARAARGDGSRSSERSEPPAWALPITVLKGESPAQNQAEHVPKVKRDEDSDDDLYTDSDDDARAYQANEGMAFISRAEGESDPATGPGHSALPRRVVPLVNSEPTNMYDPVAPSAALRHNLRKVLSCAKTVPDFPVNKRPAGGSGRSALLGASPSRCGNKCKISRHTIRYCALVYALNEIHPDYTANTGWCIWGRFQSCKGDPKRKSICAMGSF